MIKPVLQDNAFLTDVDAASTTDDVCMWWFVQSGYLIQHRQTRVLLDPYLSDSLTRKYDGTHNPHVAMTDRVIAPDQLRGISVVTSSHNHSDHLDADTLTPILRNNPGIRFLAPAANVEFAAKRLSLAPDRIFGMNDNVSFNAEGVTITGVPAAHETLETDDRGQHRCLGYIVRIGGLTLYHSGDTLLYDGMVEKLKPFKIDIALLPINGRGKPNMVGNIFGDEAATLAHDIGAKLAIPCHYDLFTANTETPELFIATCNKLGQRYRILRSGERFNASQAIRELA